MTVRCGVVTAGPGPCPKCGGPTRQDSAGWVWCISPRCDWAEPDDAA